MENNQDHNTEEAEDKANSLKELEQIFKDIGPYASFEEFLPLYLKWCEK